MLVASAILAALVGGAFGLLIVTLGDARDQQRDRTGSEQVIAVANELQQLALALESDARRYEASRRPVDLANAQQAMQDLRGVAGRLFALSGGEPRRERIARRLQRDVPSYGLTWLLYARTPKSAAARLEVAGQRAQDGLRRDLTAFVSAAQTRMNRSRERADRSEHVAIVAGGAGLGASLLLIALFAGYVSRRVLAPVRGIAAAARRLAAGEPHEDVEVAGRDEIGELGANFNAMAASIQRQQLELAGQNRDLARLATELRAVLDSTIDGIMLTDRDGVVQLANRPMRRFAAELGLAGPNVVDQLLSLAPDVVDPDRFRVALERLRNRPEEPSADEFELTRSQRTFVSYTAPVVDDARVVGRIWTLRELTQERELDRLKDEFVATVSHELRTPLTSITGFLEMLRDGEAGELTAEQERFLAIVHRSAVRLQRLVGDLLFVAQLDEGALHLQLEDGVRLDDVVAEAVEAAGADARAHEVELRLEAPAQVPVRGDRERLGQLVGNLLSNAVKFTPAGGRITARVHAENGHGVLEVEDDGIGIPAAEQERLYERFFRASTALERAVPGTGLGLAISKVIAEAHDGRISCRSAAGVGTTFRVELPAGG
jgi:signal transduction histidine kinase/HAMP domain-containing protein